MLEVIRGVLKRRLAAEAQVSLFGENTRRDLPCPYITIDVDFILSDPKQQAIEERPTDTIGKISRLYLKWSLSDQTMKPKLHLGLALVLSAGLLGCSTTHDQLSGWPVRYHNPQYDLTFSLPASWRGYSVLTRHWNGGNDSPALDKILVTEHNTGCQINADVLRSQNLNVRSHMLKV
jgi:hypothetical protein